MRQITPVKDIDEIIYDYVYGSREIKNNFPQYNKVVHTFQHHMFCYKHVTGRLKGSYKAFPEKLDEYIHKIMYNQIWDTNGYRDDEIDDIIYL